MISKKDKKKINKPKETDIEEPLIFNEIMDEADVLELNLFTDINEAFFNEANRVVQVLMEAKRNFEASRIKRYTDIIFNLHRLYVDEVIDNDFLRPRIVSSENKLRLALELTLTSEEAVQKLKEALGDAWKESDSSALREQLVQEKLQEVLIKCDGLGDINSGLTDDAAEFGHLAKYKNIILRERDRLAGEVIDLEKRLATNRYYSENLEYIIRNNEDAMSKMASRAKFAEGERLNVESKLRALMKTMEEQKDAHGKTMLKLDITNRDLAETMRKLSKKISDYERQRVRLDKYRSEVNALNKTMHKYEEDIADLTKNQKNNEEMIKQLRLIEKEKSNTVTQLTSKLKKSIEDQNNATTRLYKLNRKVMMFNSEILRHKNNINSLEKDVLNANGRTDDIRRIKETLQRERDSLRSDIIKLSNTMADFKHDMMLKANMISSLNLDINKLNVKLDEAYILKSKAEKERDEMAQEMETLHERIENYQDQISLKTSQVNDLTEKLHEKQREVHNFKKQLESVHSEKMMLHRNLENTTQERDNFRILQAKSGHQIQQLTTEISANEVKINSLNLKIEHLNNHIKELQSELKNKENLVTGLRKDMREMKAKNEMLSKTISNDELKFMKMGHELEEMRKERNLVGLQMVRRNDEIVVIKEKLQIAQNALDNGTTQYNQRVEDIRLLKKEISNLHTESVCLKHAIKSTADMRKEIVRLQRSLNQERIRIRALTEDAKTPTGVHRWRILKGEDPKKFQLLEKLQVLQKRALKQSIENSNIKNKFAEAQKTNETLKRMLSHMPTVEIKHKLVVQQRINRQMTKKLKTLSAERSLDMIEWNSRQFNYAGKLNGMEKFPLIPKPETNIAQPSEFEGPQKYLDCALFSDADTNTSLICEK
ncbi:cilia- and flagella-associated protein 58 isoform X1 [Drosophila pseudoobscura]|uniref:Cilia- and flagella-associated protein 58 isoform X1 n=7 Tax=pseudoobscura subgroup TaxID=32358 RepID=A0A6I8W3D3_DROPS|nr:cilia- and flagella-associated protein 58 isoform X1 [Drosophila pseudoobscura]